jgi:hypothetical protein
LKTRQKGFVENSDTILFAWKDVVAEVRSANETYQQAAFKALRSNSAAFEQWLTLLPDSTYSSAICGAFVVALQVHLVESLARAAITIEGYTKYL